MNQMFTVFLFLAGLISFNNVFAASSGLRTEADYHIGLSISGYQYEEPGLMSLKGPKLGLNIEATDAWSNGYFVGGDFRYAFGTVNYQSNGTGSASGEPDWYLELKEVIGKDWYVGESVISPYIGLGYRYLNNDGRGLTSTGNSGYRRESNYLYLPLGFIHQTMFRGGSMISSTFEYDYLLTGRQKSRLSDAGPFQDVTNIQGRGFGLKLSILYHRNDWAFGPYAHYWNIDQSNTEYIYLQNGTIYGIGLEPKNNTVEIGLKASQRF